LKLDSENQVNAEEFIHCKAPHKPARAGSIIK